LPRWGAAVLRPYVEMDEGGLHPGHHSIRLRGYDYSREGLYFLTICTHEKRCVLARVTGGRVELSGMGSAVRECWVGIPEHFPNTRLHAYVVMPNHLHGIVEICAGREATDRKFGGRTILPAKLGRSSAAPLRSAVAAGSLGAIVRSFKAAATKRVHLALQWSGAFWQRNYYERIVRDGAEFAGATQYILENPERWEWDQHNPERRQAPGDSQGGIRRVAWDG